MGSGTGQTKVELLETRAHYNPYSRRKIQPWETWDRVGGCYLHTGKPLIVNNGFQTVPHKLHLVYSSICS